jgi:hypothetical protein
MVKFSVKEPPCEVLSGWITVSRWEGLGSVDHYHFCSFSCLKEWAGTQTLVIPKAFLDVFKGESGEKDA